MSERTTEGATPDRARFEAFFVRARTSNRGTSRELAPMPTKNAAHSGR